MCDLNRALGRLDAGQDVEDLSWSCLWALLKFYGMSGQQQRHLLVHAELLRRSEHWRA